MRTQDLQKIGLSDKEAVIYLTSLEMGPSTILEISKQSKIKRPTVHIIVENFIKKGLASSFEKGKKRYFSVESPERLLTLFNIRKKEIEEQEREFTTFLPELKQIFASGLAEGKPVVKFFEGKAGIEAIREDILNSKIQSMEEFFNTDVSYEAFPPAPNDHRQKMKEKLKNIPVRRIYTNKSGPVLPAEDGLTKNLFVPSEKFQEITFKGEFVLYGNKIAITSPKTSDRLGIIIESEEIAKTLRAFFNLTWQILT